jgi:hypothetical protein
MNRVGLKTSLAFAILFIIPWVYIWLCDPGADAADDRSIGILAINSVSASIGSIIPKAIWYSAFFREQGNAAFADKITIVYGFCTVLLVLYLGGYFFSQAFPSRAIPQQDTGELLPRASRDRLEYIENIVLGCGALTIYYNFFGYGLSDPGPVPSESTNGDYVLGGPIFFFAVLAVAIIYWRESRVFRRRNR